MTTHAEPEPAVIDAELLAVDGVPVEQLMPQPLTNPPAVVRPGRAPLVAANVELPGPRCICGNATDIGHGNLTCDEVLTVRARVNHSQLPIWRRLSSPKPAGWRLSKAEIVAIIERERARREAAS